MKVDSTEDKTELFARPGESRMFNVSVRGWLAILLIGSVCFAFLVQMLTAASVAIYTGDMSAFNNELLKLQTAMAERLALVALGYYFGKEVNEHLSRKKPVETP